MMQPHDAAHEVAGRCPNDNRALDLAGAAGAVGGVDIACCAVPCARATPYKIVLFILIDSARKWKSTLILLSLLLSLRLRLPVLWRDTVNHYRINDDY